MLRSIFFALSLFFLAACSGSFTHIPESDKIIDLTTALPGRSEKQIFEGAYQWMQENFTLPEEPISLVVPEEGSLIGHGRIPYPCSRLTCLTKGDWSVDFDMQVDAEPQGMLTTFRNIELTSPPSGQDPVNNGGMSSPVWSERDMNAVRPLLIELNDELAAEIMQERRQ